MIDEVRFQIAAYRRARPIGAVTGSARERFTPAEPSAGFTRIHPFAEGRDHG